MAENYDLRGTVEIDVDDSVRNLMQVSQEMVALDKTAGALGDSLAKNAGEGFANVAASAAAAAKHFEDVRKQMDAIKALGPQAQSSLMRAYKMNPRSIAHDSTREALAMIDREGQAWARMYDEASRMNEKFNRDRDARDREYQARLRQHAEALRMNAQFDRERDPNALAAIQSAQAAKEAEQAYNQLANTRYALYDVATTWTMVSAATLGASAAAIKLGADYDQAFRSVQRTTFTMGDDAERLKNQLVDLTTEIPVAFDEVSKIATLGAQMDIPTENLEKFTETVSMFSSTTDVSVDKAAMSLGRLAQLSKTPIEDIDNLASSIYYVGVNSVATEGQILSIAEQIAVSGNLAGLANHEIIALAGSLASLGVQPEAARGAIMRIFANIRQAVDEGGDALKGFADLAGTSASSFAQAWLDAPQQAFMGLVEGLSDLNEAGGNVSGTLKELGFINVRDIRVWELLADNTEVYTKALLDAEGAYAENTALADGYAVQVDNLNDILTQLGNSFKATMAQFGDSEMLKHAARLALELAEGFRKLLDNPVAGMLVKVSLGAAALLGVFGLLQAIVARTTASVYGLITAQRGMSQVTGQVTGGFKGLLVALAEATQAQRRARFETDQTTAALARQNVEGQKSLTTWGAMKSIGGGVGNMLTGMLKGGVYMAGVTAAMWGLSKAVEAVSDSMKTAEDRTREFIGSTDSLLEAMIADANAAEKMEGSFRFQTEAIREAAQTSESSKESYFTAADGQIHLKDKVDDTTEALKEQQFWVGELTRQKLFDDLTGFLNESDLSNEALKLMNQLGIEWGKYVDLVVSDIADGTDKAGEYITGLLDNVEDVGEEFRQLGVNLERSLQPVTGAGHFDDFLEGARGLSDEMRAHLNPATLEFIDSLETVKDLMDGGLPSDAATDAYDDLMEVIDGFKQLKDATKELGEEFTSEGLGANMETAILKFEGVRQMAADLGIELDELGDSAEELGDDIGTLAERFQEVADAAWGSAADAEAALEALGAALYENGNDFSIYSDEGRANLAAVDAAVSALAVSAGEDVEALTANLIVMLDNLEAQGVDTVAELDHVWQYLAELTGNKYGIDLSTASARRNLITLLQDGQAVKQLLAELNAIRAQQQHTHSEAGARALAEEARGIQAQIDAVNDLSNRIASVQDEAVRTGTGVGGAINRGITNAYDKARKAASKAGGAGKKAGKDMAKSAKEAAKEIRTLTDYVSDLSSVMSSAFEIRFGKAQAEDSVTKIWNDIKNAAEDAKRAIEDAKQAILDADAKIKGLKSDKKILQYQLTVAEEYGDDLRATQIRAELADKNAELSKTELDRKRAMDDLKKAQAEQNKTLKGNSDEALKNRDTMLSLVQAYQKQIEALANSGLSTKDLDRETKRLRDEFVRQATQLGFSRTEVNKYAKSFEDMGHIIRNVPKNITVKTDMNPAKRAVQEFIAKKEKAKAVNTSAKAPSKANLNSVKNAISKGVKPAAIPISYKNPTQNAMKRMGKELINAIKAGMKIVNSGLSFMGKQFKFSIFRHGGYTGRGGTWEPAGIVHKGEYVIPQEGVNQATGLPDLNYLGQLVGNRSGGGGAVSAAATTGVQVVELSARDRQLLAAAGDVQITLDGRVVADNTNSVNRNYARRGIG